jgi:hypothetical protein
LGLSNQGLSADLVNAGVLNAGKIMIMDNDEPAFRWDKHGITAFAKNGSGICIAHQFVRFDKYGVYGINLPSIDGTTWAPENESEITAKSTF